MELRTLTEGLQFPEGPVAMADGSVLLVEIAAGTLTRVGADGRKTVAARTGGGPNGAAVGPDGKAYVANNGGFEWHREEGRIRPLVQARDYSGGRLERVDLATGAVEVLYRECNGNPLRGPNDLVIDKSGGIYFTDLGKRRARDMDVGGVYYAKPDGSSIVEVAYPMVTPNGIGLSPDEKTLYVAETEAARLWAFAIDAPGVVKKDPWPSPHGGKIVAGMGGYQRFDSLAVQEDGRIAVATLINGGITVISPDGKHIEHHPMPDPMTTNICFGGPDRKTAFITLSWTGRLVAVDWPTAGLKLNQAG
ncbi:MAG TPA: SMP-30/gluconolactonase/LRE family protein [Stellaceae bacterium]|jgi:gluconolactonase|nr:SMP-30/gluconolactonase/LRE family protein [Stellaceae bacterium]